MCVRSGVVHQEEKENEKTIDIQYDVYHDYVLFVEYILIYSFVRF